MSEVITGKRRRKANYNVIESAFIKAAIMLANMPVFIICHAFARSFFLKLACSTV
ncbi:MAG: hypothetical protein WBJ10_04335 [Daejeonella sp.]|uniref:hypothetical protein n=1 Tax=unclassified Daejeonella TaxID=2805396 RepID=UPI0023ED2EC5|nr:hypothetical protein [Daejeonella sp. JGW-45]